MTFHETPSGKVVGIGSIDLGPSRGVEWYWFQTERYQAGYKLVGEVHGPLRSKEEAVADADEQNQVET